MSLSPATPNELARRIDHTLLRPEALGEDVDRLCDEARELDFFAVCVNPIWVERCTQRLEGASPAVCTVVGFPLGASRPEVKAEEARTAVSQGVDEIDMVVNLAALLSRDEDALIHDLASVVDIVKMFDERLVVKVILETALLDAERIALGVRCAAEVGADFVKTSTGFHAAGGASVAAVRQMRASAMEFGTPDRTLRVKASGGIRDLPTALAMIEAGAERLGTSSSVGLIRAAGASGAGAEAAAGY